MQTSLPQFLSLLAGRSPELIVYVVAIVFSLVNRGRHPRAAALLLAGSAVLLLNLVGWAIVAHYVVSGRIGPRNATIGESLVVLQIARDVLSAAGLGLWLAAVFAGRTARRAEGFPVGSVPQPTSVSR